MTGEVVGVVVVGLAAEADADGDDPPAAAPVDDCPDTVVGVVAALVPEDEPDVVAVVPCAVTADEWAVDSDATRTPRPTVPAAAALPIDVVARRTRPMARSLDQERWPRGRWCSGGWVGMS